MSTQKRQKLKSVLESVPPGFLVTASWLTDQGVAYATFRDYVKRGWLERLTQGVFRRPTPSDAKRETVDWQTLALSMQNIMDYEVHVGAMTALGLLGHGHHLPLGGEPCVWLYGDRIPNWPSRIRLNAQLTTRSLSLFDDQALGVAPDRGSSVQRIPQETAWEWSLMASAPERAILESLDELPDHESFENLDRVFESLVDLRPRLLTALLDACRRVKTKRLFFVFADLHDHAWRKYVRPEDFDLGRGDRALVKGGAIHPRYRIVVPKDFVLPGGTESGDA